jgi:hypothetical protein
MQDRAPPQSAREVGLDALAVLQVRRIGNPTAYVQIFLHSEPRVKAPLSVVQGEMVCFGTILVEGSAGKRFFDPEKRRIAGIGQQKAQVEGRLEGYILSGRHGLINTYILQADERWWGW